MKVAISKLPDSGWWSKGMPKYNDNPAMIESAIPNLKLLNEERTNLKNVILQNGHDVIEFDFPDERFNPHGGAVSIGHPLGATGARCLMTLTNALIRTNSNRGIVTICLGGGNAVGMLIQA